MSAPSAATSSCDGDRRSGGNAPFFFEKFREFSRFENGQSREVFDNLVQICHGSMSCLYGSVVGVDG
jgi:hypothetical protein